MKIKVGVVGAGGYAGHELIRILMNHKNVSIEKIFSSAKILDDYKFRYRNFFGKDEMKFEEINWETMGEEIDVLFTAMPYGILMKHLNEDILKRVKIIDLGVDYRHMSKEEYKKYYRSDHESFHLADRFIYGLSEWNRVDIKEAEHIANPGCYATASELALLPFIKENLIEYNGIIIDGKCGLSGAGRNLSLGTHFTEANESTKAYKVVDHPHRLEIKKTIEMITGKEIEILFTPHIVPMQRGLLVTIYCRLKDGVCEEHIKDVLDKYYGEERFVHILDEGMYVETKWVKSSNNCHINFKVDDDTGMVVIMASIDNLIKGAAGQAVQNMNIMFGFNENESLDFVGNCL